MTDELEGVKDVPVQSALPEVPPVTTEVPHLYWGDEEVLSMVDGIDPGTKRVTTDCGSFDVPGWEANAVISKVKGDDSTVRTARSIYVAGEVLGLLHNLDIRIEEVGHCLQRVVGSLQENEAVAILAGFGINAPLYDTIQDAKLDVRLSTIDKVLKSLPTV